MAVLLTVQLMLFSTLPFCSGEQQKILIIIMCFTVHIIVRTMMSYDSKWLDSNEGPIASSAWGLKLQLLYS